MSARAKVGDAQGEGGAWAPSPSAAEMWARAPAFRTTVLCMSNVNAGQGFPPPQPTGRDERDESAGAEPTRPLYTKWWFWLAAHVFFLIGFRNRLSVLINWAVAYWSYQRAARIIIGHKAASGDNESVDAG